MRSFRPTKKSSLGQSEGSSGMRCPSGSVRSLPRRSCSTLRRTMSSESPYKMTLTLNVLTHLGLNLYSNMPAVLAEVVANSWDADAEHVDITIEPSGSEVSITDDGHGMDQGEVNDKYLTVGYERRLKKETRVTPKFHREVMGRKGIGKLSLFSVANVIEVY